MTDRPNAFAELRCIAVNGGFVDPAIDLTRSAVHLYGITRDRVHLALSDGEEPYEFVVKRLPKRLSAEIQSLRSPEAYWLAFKLGCHRVEKGGKLVLEADLNGKGAKKGLYGTMIAPDEWLDEVADFVVSEGVGFGLSTVEEMGRVVFSAMKLAAGAAGPFDLRV